MHPIHTQFIKLEQKTVHGHSYLLHTRLRLQSYLKQQSRYGKRWLMSSYVGATPLPSTESSSALILAWTSGALLRLLRPL